MAAVLCRRAELIESEESVRRYAEAHDLDPDSVLEQLRAHEADPGGGVMGRLDRIARGTLALNRREDPSAARLHDDDELWTFLRDQLEIEVQREVHPDCRGKHVAPFEALADAYFGQVPLSLWIASRGFGGKTYLLAALAAVRARHARS